MAQWADQPYSLIPCTKTTKPNVSAEAAFVADDMANAHNCLIRSLNSMHIQAPYVKEEQDIQDLLQYAYLWASSLHHHHTGEENVLFPAFAKATGVEDIMEVNVKQHEAFTPGLEAFEAYVKECQKTESTTKFNAVEFRKMIDAFAPTLVEHLGDEIDTLLGLDKYGGKMIKDVFMSNVRKQIGAVDKNVMFPLMLGATDKGFPGSENFPPLPGFLIYLTHYWFQKKYVGSWRFNPSTYWGQRQPLYFLPRI